MKWQKTSYIFSNFDKSVVLEVVFDHYGKELDEIIEINLLEGDIHSLLSEEYKMTDIERKCQEYLNELYDPYLYNED